MVKKIILLFLTKAQISINIIKDIYNYLYYLKQIYNISNIITKKININKLLIGIKEFYYLSFNFGQFGKSNGDCFVTSYTWSFQRTPGRELTLD